MRFVAKPTYGTIKPVSWEKIEYLNLPTIFVTSNRFNCSPITFKGALIKKTKCSGVFSNFSSSECLLDDLVEITFKQLNHSFRFGRLLRHKLFQMINLFRIVLAKNESAEPLGFAFQNQFG